MCGIARIFDYSDQAPPVDSEELLRIRERMIKRGPDGAGLWIAPDHCNLNKSIKATFGPGTRVSHLIDRLLACGHEFVCGQSIQCSDGE